VSLLQSTTGVNIIFVNIDWKSSRHNTTESTRRNLKKLTHTITSIVTNMKPALICCCEVGEAKHPMSMEQMQAVADTIRAVWEAAATVHPLISVLFEVDAPYLTIWDDNLCSCKHGRILKNVYNVPGHRRVAQAFLCIMPGESDEAGIDIVNAHAPSGDPPLTDSQRFQLMRNLLQRQSMARADKRIGEVRFIVGGDLNSNEITLSQILNQLRDRNILTVSNELLFPTWAKPGDMCVVGGFTATLLRVRADNHDPRHEPYGIVWSRQPQHATEQLTTTPPTQIPPAPETKNESRASGSTGEQPQSDPPVAAGYLDRHMSQLPLEKASAAAWPATEQPHGPRESETVTPEKPLSRLPLLKFSWAEEDSDTDKTVWTTTPAKSETGTIAVAETTLPAPKEPTQTRTNKGQRHDGRNTEATRPATEQPQSGENEPPILNGPAQELAYCIVNAFMNNLTFECAATEVLIKRIIRAAGDWTPGMLLTIDEVFRPIFVEYPDGLQDRTRAVPRDANQYIRHWRDIAGLRERVHGQCPEGTRLTERQVQTILQYYIDDFIRNEADARQRRDSRSKNSSRVDVRLRRLCGSTHMARAIWQVGLPNVQEQILYTLEATQVLTELVPATEQPLNLEQDLQNAIATATVGILTWLSSIATSIQSYKETPKYMDHARKSGTQKELSGLTAAELEVKEEKKRANRLKYGRRPATQWQYTLTQWQ